MPEIPNVIVIGLDCMTGLQSTRIFVNHGIPVIGIAKNAKHYCARSRLPEKIYEADIASEAFITLLERIGPDFAVKPVLIPCTDMSVFQISTHREKLEPYYRFALPAHDTVAMLMNKVSFYQYALDHELAIPKTFLLHNKEDAERFAEELSYPALLKPPLKTKLWEANTTHKAYKVENKQELLDIYENCHSWSDILLAQAWVSGTDSDLFSCNCYFDAQNQPQVTFIARKLRQWPPETGTSCLGEEIRDDKVLEESIKLFKSVDYHGLGYVEIKRDQSTQEYFIIEPNIGRPTGRSAIAEAGGVELLYTAYCDLVGRPLPENRTQQYEGVKWISLRRDFQSALFYWRRGDLTLREWIRSWQGRKAYAIFSWKDPLPFIFDFFKLFAIAKDKLFRH